MNRTEKKLSLGNGIVRYVTRLSTDLCDDTGAVSRQLRLELLTLLSSQPELSICGPVDFQIGKIFYDGLCWVVELQADVRPNA